MSDLLQSLSPVQREAAENYEGPSLIVAGAGSGKTRVLTYRIAYMLERGVAPFHILALTFTNKAAREMKERIGTLVSEARARSLWMGTFHSVFARILRAEAEKLGYPQSFTIYDTADSRNVVKQVIKEMNLSDETYKPNEIYSRISLAKNNLVTAAAYESNAMLMAEDRERRRPQFYQVYQRYTQKCKEYGAMDFDDLLLNMNILLRDHPDVLARYQQRFQYVLVDEYQDTNAAQYLIVKKLVEGHHNICVVGDDAQSIYSFRGARIENILRFQKDYPEAKYFKLEENYRSTQTIVNAANCVIEKNRHQLPKKLFSSKGEGEKLRVFRAYTDREEASMVIDDLYGLLRGRQVQYRDMAILYRTNAQSRVLEESLRLRNIPYKIYGGQSFYQRKEIKDVLAYIRLVVNSQDDEALRRIVNYPARGIGEVTVGKIAATAAVHNISMWRVISTLTSEQMGLGAAAAKKLTEFQAMIAGLGAAVHTTPAYEMGLRIATASGILGSHRMQQTPEAMSALENIEELLNSIAVFSEQTQRERPDEAATIVEWLQNVALLTDLDNDEGGERNHVTLMTIHSAKGLEFDYVYIVGLEETLFPSAMTTDSPEQLEEERRLFYVALTRARREAILAFAQSRFRWGDVTYNRPSRFIAEIDDCYLDRRYDDDPAAGAGRAEPPARPGAFGSWGDKRQESARPVYRRPDPSGRSERRDPAPGPAGGVVRKFSTPDPVAMRPMGTRLKAETPSAGAPSASAGGLAVGARVEHDKFGPGTIAELEETANGAKAVVRFDSVGEKTLLLKYARLKIIEC